MKKIKKSLLLAIVIAFAGSAHSNDLNWAGLNPETRHLVKINVGWDYGLVVGVGYGYRLKTKLPAVLDLSYSVPSGKKLLDDFKVKIGGQVRLVQIRDFGFSANVHGIFRRHENPEVRMLNFGSDFSGVIGYYKPKWFVAGQAGFDKAIVSNFRHSKIFKENTYVNVKDGWYEPAAGGNFYYGLQTGFSVKQSEITFGLGKVLTQDFKAKPLIPYYARVGFTWKINDLKKG